MPCFAQSVAGSYFSCGILYLVWRIFFFGPIPTFNYGIRNRIEAKLILSSPPCSVLIQLVAFSVRMELTFSSYTEVAAQGTPIDQLELPTSFQPLFRKVSLQNLPPQSAFAFVNLRESGDCSVLAVYKKVEDSGILLQSESDFPTAVIFDDLEALALRVTEQGKAVLMNITRNDASTNAQLANISISAPNMSYTFYSAAKFNNMIENWDVSNVINMACMFYLGRISVNTREELLKFLM